MSNIDGGNMGEVLLSLIPHDQLDHIPDKPFSFLALQPRPHFALYIFLPANPLAHMSQH